MAEYGIGRKIGLVMVAVAAACSLAACGGSGGDSATAATGANSAASNGTNSTAPTYLSSASSSTVVLSGAPATSIAPGAAYTFAPQLTPAGTSASFSITNKPSWASFSVVTGTLSGTPGNADIGVASGIVIAAVTANGTAALPAFSIQVALPSTATNGSATLSWTPPTQATDGSELPNLGGYNIYFGSSADSLTTKIQITNPGLTAYTVAGLGAGTHVFGITAWTTAGTESDLAIVGSKTIM